MNKFIFLISTIIMVAFLGGCASGSSSSSSNDQVKIRLAHNLPESHFTAKAMDIFADEVNKAGEGSIQVDVFPSGQLHTDKEMMEAVTGGSVEMGLNNTPLWQGSVPSIDILSLPMLFDSYQDVHKAIDEGLGEALAKDIEKVGAYPIAWADYGFTFFSGNKELKKPEDFKGMKIRVHSATAGEFLQELGGSPVFMGGAEVETALQRGTVDGGTSGPTSFYTRGYFRSLDYAVKNANTGYAMYILAINKKFYDGLSDEHKQILQDAAQKAQEFTRAEVEKEDNKAWDSLEAEGMNLLEITQEEKNTWLEKAQTVWDKFSERVDNGKELIEMAR